MTGQVAEFQRLSEPHRAELRVHCYRMLGSLQDAEDLVQETYLRAWRGWEGFQGRASLRGWLYRIATNACLNVLERRKTARRLLPEAVAPAVDGPPCAATVSEVPWLEPFPDALMEGVPDQAPGPEARYETEEAVRLAFVAAIQHLAPRPRAILLLRDVLGFSAAETAQLLDSSETSVNSALRRARLGLRERLPPGAQPTPSDQVQPLLDRYLQTWESTDVDGFVTLLREEAILSMPPYEEWYAGRDAIRTFLAWRWLQTRGWRHVLRPTAANGQPAFAAYRIGEDSPRGRASAIHVLTLKEGRIAAVTAFIEPRLLRMFGLPEEP